MPYLRGMVALKQLNSYMQSMCVLDIFSYMYNDNLPMLDSSIIPYQ